MSSVTLITENIYRIDAQLAGAQMPAVSYLIAGNPAALIETGPTSAAPALLDALRQIGQDPTKIAFIIPTHIHIDHGGGVGYLGQQWPGAKIVLHEQGAPHLLEPSKLIAGTKRAFGDQFEETFGPILAVAQSQVIPVKGGETLSLGNRELKIIDTPGHAPNHISVYDSASRGLFCGEALGLPLGETGFVLPTAIPPNFDLKAALETIEKAEKLAPAILFYSHDGVSRDVKNRLQAARTTTRRAGDLVLSGLKSGEKFEQVLERVSQGLAQDGLPVSGLDFSAMVGGYMLYFQKEFQKGKPA
ncbi:MAG: MBL fold metallo-hydrolase [Dehalococcoidia bacterium]|nr:MBL fold metallo-hydrolase [Dehalococcoidia bacterium]